MMVPIANLIGGIMKQVSVDVPAAEAGNKDFNVYFRNDDGSLGCVKAENFKKHKEAITFVKEGLVAEGDGLENKAVLAVINGGKN
jgi:hypothetical protein